MQDPLQPPGSLESFCVQTGISSQNLPVHNCAFATGTTFAVPVFNHMGYNLEKPSYCDWYHLVLLYMNFILYIIINFANQLFNRGKFHGV